MEIKRIFTTIDTHTAGGPTRIITSGLPTLPGSNVAEKLKYFKEHYDGIRKLPLLEPRGHNDMYGAVITETDYPNADLRAFFMTASGYLSTCVHSSIGIATALLEIGSLSPKQPTREIIMETAAGLISLQPNYLSAKLVSISLQTKLAFIYTPDIKISVNGVSLQAIIIFSGVFFAMLNVAQLGKTITPENIAEFVTLGKAILAEVNRCIEISHPENPDIREIALVILYEDLGERHVRDIVVGKAGGIDRSPCGAGSGAMATYEFMNGHLGLGESFSIESVLGTKFDAKVVSTAKVGLYEGAVPCITGSAFLTGFHQFILEDDDLITEGFKLA